MTEPLPTDPLLTPERLALWAQERPLVDPEFADLIIEAVTVLLRHYGSASWTAANIPTRARDIGYIVAKDYYLNPTLIRQESLGPLQETRSDLVLQGLDFNEDQQKELAALATDDPGQIDGLWALSATRGPLETHRDRRGGNTIIYDTREAWPIEYLTAEDSVVFFPEPPEA